MADSAVNDMGSMDDMQKAAAEQLAVEAAQRKADDSAAVLATATAAREGLEAQQLAEARAAAQAEADVLAEEERVQAVKDAKRKAYTDALAAEAEAKKQADADAAAVDKLTAKPDVPKPDASPDKKAAPFPSGKA